MPSTTPSAVADRSACWRSRPERRAPASRARKTAAISPIDATGGADVTAELQALIDRTPNGGVVRLQPGGRYRVEGTLLLVDRQRLTIDGNGARLFATTTGGERRSHLRVVGGTDLVVRDLEIIGANPHAGLDDRAYQEDLVGQHGVRLEGVTDVELSHLRISDIYGDFVYVGRRDDGQWSRGRVDPRLRPRAEWTPGHRRDRRSQTS